MKCNNKNERWQKRKRWTPSNELTSSEHLNREIDRHRKNLPIYEVRERIINVVKKNSTLIFIGETACGKTTQIPQYLHEDECSNKRQRTESFNPKKASTKMIAITQPRRVAAISIATRVSEEIGTTLGDIVGYSVRFDDTTSKSTRIKYLTDGMLLREAIGDPLLSDYQTIILDEAHERTIQTDVLFGIVKRAQQLRKIKQPLKVIIMSATMDVDHFAEYFGKVPVYYLPGRQHDIKLLYAVKKQSDHIHSALTAVLQVHREEPSGDILVFCTGQEEIESMVRTISESKSQWPAGTVLKPFGLYAAMPAKTQMDVFKALPRGERKVIFATNIAETSITIPNVKYVIDTGKVKAKVYQAASSFETLKIQTISKAQAIQRSGRAGRESR